MFQDRDINLENVTHETAVATLKATHERVVLLVAKLESPFPILPQSNTTVPSKAPSEISNSSPQPRK